MWQRGVCIGVWGWCRRALGAAILAVALITHARAWGETRTGPSGAPPQGAGDVPRNLIVLIGDGMGFQQLALLRLLSEALKANVPLPSNIRPPEPPAFVRFVERAQVGVVFPSSDGTIVVDSACAGTAIATGEIVAPRTIGIRRDGSRTESVLQLAERLGRPTGIVSDTRLTHATPASFVAHVSHRSAEREIAAQLLTSGVEVLLSAGSTFFPQPAPAPSRGALTAISSGGQPRPSGLRLGDYALVRDRYSLATAAAPKILGLFAPTEMPDGITEYRHRDSQGRTVPTLREMTRHALRLLGNRERGFFLMVEAGQIDWAGHANDAGWLLYEMIRFDAVLREIMAWMEENPDTLLVVTADHETGSFGFSYTGSPGTPGGKTEYNFGSLEMVGRLLGQTQPLGEILSGQGNGARWLADRLVTHLPFPVGRAAQAAVIEGLAATERGDPPCRGERAGGLLCPFYPDADDYLSGLIARDIGPAQGIVWGTGTHTSSPVGVFAYGAPRFAARFAGTYSQAELGRRLKAVIREEGGPERRVPRPIDATE